MIISESEITREEAEAIRTWNLPVKEIQKISTFCKTVCTYGIVTVKGTQNAAPITV